jgi:hypothetical protein
LLLEAFQRTFSRGIDHQRHLLVFMARQLMLNGPQEQVHISRVILNQ